MSVADTIRDKLTSSFAPSEISVTDDSHRHAGHSGATRADGGNGVATNARFHDEVLALLAG